MELLTPVDYFLLFQFAETKISGPEKRCDASAKDKLY